MNRAALAAVGLAALVAATGPAAQGRQFGTAMTPLFAPVDIGADISSLPPPERAALARIIDAARVMDALFLEQVWAGNPSLLLALQGERDARNRARRAFFLVNKGPWSRVEDNRAFIPGVPPKPAGAAYYPPDATRDEVAAWIDGLSEAESRGRPPASSPSSAGIRTADSAPCRTASSTRDRWPSPRSICGRLPA